VDKEDVEERFELYHADAFDEVKNLKNQGVKVNHIITDPPFNISQKNNFSTMRGNRKGIDFGKWDWGFDLTGWVSEYESLLEKGGSMIVFSSFRHMSKMIEAMEKSNLEVKDVLKWIKVNPMPRNIERRYVQDTEFAIWAVKPKGKWIFNRQVSIKYERAEFRFPVVAGKERTLHPNQKPQKLMNEIIKIHTNQNDVILDPFMGSGTTGVSAIELDRSFIGIECEQIYFDIAKRRLCEVNQAAILSDYRKVKVSIDHCIPVDLAGTDEEWDLVLNK